MSVIAALQRAISHSNSGVDQLSASSPVSLSHFTPAGKANVYIFSSASTAIVKGADVWVRPGGATMSFPASSITLVVGKKS